MSTNKAAVFSDFTFSPAAANFVMLVKAMHPSIPPDGFPRPNPINPMHDMTDSIITGIFKPDISDSLPYNNTVERFFFPIRWAVYKDDSQLECSEDNKELWTPNEVDKTKPTDFERLNLIATTSTFRRILDLNI